MLLTFWENEKTLGSKNTGFTSGLATNKFCDLGKLCLWLFLWWNTGHGTPGQMKLDAVHLKATEMKAQHLGRFQTAETRHCKLHQ